ncbi:MAG: dephospho-CoA kinase [Planctomycetota bacterium]
MSRTHNKPVIGVTGGVGAGKSTVAQTLGACGCEVIDADALGHEVIQTPSVRDALVARWGAGVRDADGRVDRAAVARIVFDDADELAFLNAQMHPPLRDRMAERIAHARRNRQRRGVALDAAVLFEAGWDDLCTHTVCVTAPRAQRTDRLRRERGWDEGELDRREKRQISLDTKLAMCDYTLENSSGVSRLRKQVRTLFHDILHSVDCS